MVGGGKSRWGEERNSHLRRRARRGEDGKWKNWLTDLSGSYSSNYQEKKVERETERERERERERESREMEQHSRGSCFRQPGLWVSRKNKGPVTHCHLTCTHRPTQTRPRIAHTIKHTLICEHPSANIVFAHTHTRVHILKQLSIQSQVNFVAAPPHHHPTDGHGRT